MIYEHELEVALIAARRAGDLALRYFDQETAAEEKPDFSPVTIADRESEKLICGLLGQKFPDDGILGEEGAFEASRSGRRWLIDPVDGTRDFVRRTPFWSVQIALEEAGRIVLGIIHFPCLKETLHAVSGSRCFWNDAPTRASLTSRLDRSILMVSGFQAVWKTWGADPLRYLTEHCWTVRGYGGCYDVAMLARGKADIWLSGNGMEWDYAPARIVAEECGARFLTSDGGDRIDRNHCVICVPGLESELRKILRIP